jgi:hypothetical protein
MFIPKAWPKAAWCSGFDHAIPEMIFGTLESAMERYPGRRGISWRMRRIDSSPVSLRCLRPEKNKTARRDAQPFPFTSADDVKFLIPRIHHTALLRIVNCSRPARP